MSNENILPSQPVTVAFTNDELEIVVDIARHQSVIFFTGAIALTLVNFACFLFFPSLFLLVVMGFFTVALTFMGFGAATQQFRILASPKTARAQTNGYDQVEVLREQLRNFYVCERNGGFALAAETSHNGQIPFIAGFQDEESARTAQTELHRYWAIDFEPGAVQSYPDVSREQLLQMITETQGEDSFAYDAISNASNDGA